MSLFKRNIKKEKKRNDFFEKKSSKLNNNLENKKNVESFDECFISIGNLIEEYGWATKGEKYIVNADGRKFRNGLSLLMSINKNGVSAFELIKGFNDFFLKIMSVKGPHITNFITKKILKRYDFFF